MKHSQKVPIKLHSHDDTKLVMESAYPYCAVERDVRFLEYRLDVIAHWPESPRKRASREAISRRLTSIARGTLAGRDVDALLAASCRLLDTVFSAGPKDPPASRRAA
jgi:hypothetical protein